MTTRQGYLGHRGGTLSRADRLWRRPASSITSSLNPSLACLAPFPVNALPSSVLWPLSWFHLSSSGLCQGRDAGSEASGPWGCLWLQRGGRLQLPPRAPLTLFRIQWELFGMPADLGPAPVPGPGAAQGKPPPEYVVSGESSIMWKPSPEVWDWLFWCALCTHHRIRFPSSRRSQVGRSRPGVSPLPWVGPHQCPRSTAIFWPPRLGRACFPFLCNINSLGFWCR